MNPLSVSYSNSTSADATRVYRLTESAITANMINLKLSIYLCKVTDIAGKGPLKCPGDIHYAKHFHCPRCTSVT